MSALAVDHGPFLLGSTFRGYFCLLDFYLLLLVCSVESTMLVRSMPLLSGIVATHCRTRTATRWNGATEVTLFQMACFKHFNIEPSLAKSVDLPKFKEYLILI